MTRALLLIALVTAPLLARDPTYRLFVTNEEDNTVSVIDSRSHELVRTIDVGKRPRGIGFSPDRSKVYVALGDDNAIGEIDTVSLRSPQDSRRLRPRGLAVHPNGNIYLSNEDAGLASVLNPSNGEILAEIKVGIEPEGGRDAGRQARDGDQRVDLDGARDPRAGAYDRGQHPGRRSAREVDFSPDASTPM